MQKVALSLADNALLGTFGGGLGAATNDGNRAAGAIGGGIGSILAPKLAVMLGRAVGMDKAPDVLQGIAGLGVLGMPIPGGYFGGKLGAKIDQHFGNPVTKTVNKLLGRN